MGNSSDNTYIKAFNIAYLLAKYNSKLLNSILETPNESIYFQGLVDGKNTYDLERKNDRLREVERLRSNVDRDKGIER